MRLLGLLAPMAMLAACDEAAGPGSTPEASAKPSPPVVPAESYGPFGEIRGIWETGFETSSFAICGDAQCRMVSDPETCWLDGDAAFFEAVNRTGVRQIQAAPNPRYMVVLKGRVLRGLGYGHLGAHPCQVEARELISIVEWKSG